MSVFATVLWLLFAMAVFIVVFGVLGALFWHILPEVPEDDDENEGDGPTPAAA